MWCFMSGSGWLEGCFEYFFFLHLGFLYDDSPFLGGLELAVALSFFFFVCVFLLRCSCTVFSSLPCGYLCFALHVPFLYMRQCSPSFPLGAERGSTGLSACKAFWGVFSKVWDVGTYMQRWRFIANHLHGMAWFVGLHGGVSSSYLYRIYLAF